MAKYFGVTLRYKLRWKDCVKKKQEEKKQKSNVKTVVEENSIQQPTIKLHKWTLNPVCGTYGIKSRNSTKESNIIVQHFQDKKLKNIINTPTLIKNSVSPGIQKHGS